MLGDKDSFTRKIDEIKEKLITEMEEVDKATAMVENTNDGDLTPLAAILGKSPEALAEELAAKGESLQKFIEDYKLAKAEAAAADIQSEKNAKQWHDRLVSYAADVGKNIGSALTDWITGAKTASEAMKDFVNGLIKNAVQLMAQWVGVYTTLIAFGLYDPREAAKAATKIVLGVGDGGKSLADKKAGHAAGGYISGPGTGTSDSIPAMLSNGEYVLRSSAVDRIGIGTLNALNSGALRFAEGGSVDADATVAGVGNSVTLQVSAVDAASFADFLDRGGLDKIKQALFEDNRRFSSGVGVW